MTKIKKWQKFNKAMEPTKLDTIIIFITALGSAIGFDLNLKYFTNINCTILCTMLGLGFAWFTSTIIVECIANKKAKKEQKQNENEPTKN